MDPVTHSLTGLVLARALLPARRGAAARYATAALVVGANVPDLDIVYLLGGPVTFLDYNRGWTHSLVGAALLGAAVGIALWKLAQRRRVEGVRWRPLVLLGLLGALTHSLLDGASAEGAQLLWPLNRRWLALDWFPYIDLWLITLLLLGLGLPALFRLISEEIGARRKEGVSRGAWVALAACALLTAGRATLHGDAVTQLESRLYRDRMPARAAAFPQPLTPFRWHGVVETGTSFETLEVTRGGRQEESFQTFYKPEDSPALGAALETRTAEVFLARARFPHAEVSPARDGWRVRLRDLRYEEYAPPFHRMAVWVRLDGKLGVVSERLVRGAAADALPED